ncbi:MAG: protein kinase [Myxococcales bacterium]|nr:protein kinase [Myxococcales bacterium]
MLCPHCGAETVADARFCGACGRATAATEPSYKDLNPPGPPGAGDLTGRDIAGRYRVLSKLGEGGMGAVYRGEQISLKRTVAIKVLRPELSANPGLVRRFNAEAELAAKLSHPNTVNIYDFGQDGTGALFIAMEYLEGRSLRQVVTTEGPLPPARALAIGRQIAASLSDAHGHGIVHRDLKPDNVMLTERGREHDVVRVLDFGIAKLRDDNRQTVNAMTQAGDLVGTPQYMAPEQIRGDEVDGRTDVYALGAMLYEMVTGRLPFEGPTVMAVLSKHLTETPPPPTARRPDLGLAPALDSLIMAALAKEPSQRPPSMDHYAEQMAALAPHVGGTAAGFGGPMGHASTAMAVPSPVPGFASTAAPPGPPPAGPAPSRPGMMGPPVGPPPGVPRSYPPGVLTPRPMPQPYPPMAPAPYPSMAPARRGSLLWLWILLGLLAAGGIAAAVVISQQRSTKPSTTADDGDDDDVNDWNVGPGPTPPPPPPAAAWGTFRDPDAGWQIEVPPGLPTSPNVLADGTRLFAGFHKGSATGVAMYALPGDARGADDDALATVAESVATSLGATLLDHGPVTDGAGRYVSILVKDSERVEMRFFVGSTQLLAALYSVTGDFDGQRAIRARFFASVVLP